MIEFIVINNLLYYVFRNIDTLKKEVSLLYKSFNFNLNNGGLLMGLEIETED